MFYDGSYRSCEINAVLVYHCQAVAYMNCFATLHEMCIMNVMGVVNEQVVFCWNILFLFWVLSLFYVDMWSVISVVLWGVNLCMKVWEVFLFKVKYTEGVHVDQFSKNHAWDLKSEIKSQAKCTLICTLIAVYMRLHEFLLWEYHEAYLSELCAKMPPVIF